MHAREIPARQRERAMALRAGREHDGVVARSQLLVREVRADAHAVGELDALGLELRHAAVDQLLLELEVGDAVAQEAAGAVVALVDRDRVPRARELLRGGEPRGPRADHADAVAGALLRGLRDDPALLPGALDDRPLDLLDRHRVVVDREHAGLLARRRAELAGQLGEAVGGVQARARLLPVPAVDEVVPVGDEVAERAAAMAERDAARHAAARLLAHLALRGVLVHVPVVAHALERRTQRSEPALHLEESARISHGRLPARGRARPRCATGRAA
jgi:hypothetical protein